MRTGEKVIVRGRHRSLYLVPAYRHRFDVEHPPIVKGWLWPRLVRPCLRTPILEPCPSCGADQECAASSLNRCEIKAPYAGRIWHKFVDVGQYVMPGTSLARVYAVNYAEVRLPIPDKDLA